MVLSHPVAPSSGYGMSYRVFKLASLVAHEVHTSHKTTSTIYERPQKTKQSNTEHLGYKTKDDPTQNHSNARTCSFVPGNISH